MKLNLDGLSTEIQKHLEHAGLAVFYSQASAIDSAAPRVLWDCQQHPDFREFVETARAANVKLMVFHQREFTIEQIDEAMEQLAECDLPREEYREFERRLKEMRAFDGFVCEIELSFTHDGCIFIFDLRTDWYRVLSEVIGEIDALMGIDDDADAMGGYFSKN